MLNRVRDWIEKSKMIRHGDKIVIGLSGGADSVCLFRVLCGLSKEYALTLYAVHINHMIRGRQADSDADFARELAKSYGVEFRCASFPIPQLAVEWKMTEEEAGRKVRYDEFEKMRVEKEADWIAVAHHQNDQVETILFRMCRGTGIRGMTGIPVNRDRIIRPLNEFSKNDIYSYLDKIGQDFREDATNNCDDYDRNRIRNIVIPELEKVNESAVRHIADMSGQLAQIYDWLTNERDSCYKKYVTETSNSCKISVQELRQMHPALAGEVVRSMIAKLTESLKDVEMRHINGIIALADMSSGKQIDLPYGLIAEKQYEYLRIYNNKSGKNGAVSHFNSCEDNKKICVNDKTVISYDNVYLPQEKSVGCINIKCSLLKPEETKIIIPKNNCTKWFDCDKIKNTLSVRRPNADDYLIIGSNCRKRLTRYIIDNKIPRQFRQQLLVIADGNHVLWVIGGRASQGCYVNDNTSEIFQVQVSVED